MLESKDINAAAQVEETGLLDRVKRQKDSPVQRPLKEQMEIDLVVNEKSQVWVCYDKPMPDLVEWIEYDLDLDRVVFVFRGGKMADYGEKIVKDVRTYLKNATSAYLVYMKDKKIEDMGIVEVIVRRPLN